MSQGLDTPIDAEPAATAGRPAGPAPAPGRAAARRPGMGLWVRVGLAVMLLGASAAGRAWQSRRVDQMLRDGRVSPFPLKDLPKSFGPWVGDDEALDPAIARATGSTDSLSRVYQNKITGQRLSLIVLFGPSTEMYIHSPENCYPTAGYEKVSGPKFRMVPPNPDAKPEDPASKGVWPFHELIYLKGEGGQTEEQEVYYTWRYSGAWTPALTTQKGFERIPGMFKVHVSRRIRETELDHLNIGNPCVRFLSQLMPEIDRRIAASRAHRPAPAPAVAAGTPR
jgi:hypothetical protein